VLSKLDCMSQLVIENFMKFCQYENFMEILTKTFMEYFIASG